MGSHDFSRWIGEAFVEGTLRGAFAETRWGYLVVGLSALACWDAFRSARRGRRRGGRR